jgi:hypothetical protein
MLDNLLVSSFMLFLDNQILTQGSSFSNQSGLFFPDNDEFIGDYTYSCSYLQLVNDTSISGANIMSGVYLNNTFVGIGTSGLSKINHYDGNVSFSNPLPSGTIISGNFSIKDFNVYLSDSLDYKVVMDTKFSSNPKYSQQATGVPLGEKVMPAIFLIPKTQEAKDLAFAGLDDNFMRIRGVIVCQNAYQRVGISNILKNLKLKQFPLIASTSFDYLGNYTGINYNYFGSSYYGAYSPFVRKVTITDMPNSESYTDSTRQFSTVDFSISLWATHQ